MSWTRGPRARAAGGSLHTGVILKTLSGGGVSGSSATPKLLWQGGPSSLSYALFLKLE